MRLLIDYLEDASAYLRERKESLRKLRLSYHHVYDPDMVRETKAIEADIRRKKSEVTNELLYNLEEFRAIHRYFPDLLSAFMEDEDVGPVISEKAWLLDFRPLAPKVAAAKLQKLREWRAQLRDAKDFLRKWVGTIDAKSILATYPALKGHMHGEMEKEDAMRIVEKVDRLLIREGWLLLINDSLIRIPVAKFMNKLIILRQEEINAQHEYARVQGKGTVAESTALKKLKDVRRKKEHYEKVLAQLLLANPSFLGLLRKKKGWASRQKPDPLEKFAQGVTPHQIKERVWLNEMKMRLK
jgi:hypothetical protein